MPPETGERRWSPFLSVHNCLATSNAGEPGQSGTCTVPIHPCLWGSSSTLGCLAAWQRAWHIRCSPLGAPLMARVTRLRVGAAEVEAGPGLNLPHGYIAQSASDLMLFTNPLVQDTLPPDWENRSARLHQHWTRGCVDNCV